MNYFFKQSDFNLEKYDFNMECIPKLKKKELDLFSVLCTSASLATDYYKIPLNKLKFPKSDLKDTLISLSKKVVHLYIAISAEDIQEQFFNLFEYIIINKDEVIYKFSANLEKSRELGNFYSRINMFGILQLKHIYTKEIYKRIIKNIEKKGVIYFELEELKRILYTKDLSYSRFYNFENKILKPLAKDIEKCNIIIHFEKVKNNHLKTSRVIGIKIHYINIIITQIYKETNEIIKNYSSQINDFSKAYEFIYNYRKSHNLKETVSYVENNKSLIFD